MIDKLKGMPVRILDWWNRFDKKRKMIFISAGAVVIIALAILSWVLTRPTMVELITCESTEQASEIKKVLDTNEISCWVSDNGLLIKVNGKDLSAANLALGSSGYSSAKYDLESVFSGGFSSTEADKNKKYKAYLESQIVSDLETMDIIKDASVRLEIPLDDGTIISQKEDTYASVTLTLNGEMNDEQAAGIAKFIASAVGNKDTSSITIIDSNAKLLYSGEETDESGISASNLATAATKQETEIKKKVRSVMLEVYDNVTVAPSLKLDNAKKTVKSNEYTAAEGQKQGLLSSESSYTSESSGGSGGTPGTDSNDDTTYQIQDDNGTKSTIEEYQKNYQPNETETITEQGAGSVVLDESKISVVATKAVYYNEEELEKQGELKGMTFDEFIAQNREKVRTDVDEELYQLVSTATGIAQGNITILAYEVPVFQPKTSSALPYSTIFTIVMGVLVLGLLGFVVFKGTRPLVVEEEQPELPVDMMLATAREELDNIDYNEKSEARKMIEKFVDEKPEAVAQLLRNWLNEDWE